MKKTFLPAFFTVFCLTSTANADCRTDIQDMLAAGESWQNYRIETQTSMGGTVVQHSRQLFVDYSHFYQIVQETGVHWLVLGNDEFTSSDGKTWQRSQLRSKSWLEETLARNVELRESIRDTQCGTEVIDGTAYLRLAHVQETLKPVASVSKVVTWLETTTLRPMRRQTATIINPQGNDNQPASQIDMVADYIWDEEIVLPSP